MLLAKSNICSTKTKKKKILGDPRLNKQKHHDVFGNAFPSTIESTILVWRKRRCSLDVCLPEK